MERTRMRQQRRVSRRISVGIPGGAPGMGGGPRQRRISVTNKLGQTVAVPSMGDAGGGGGFRPNSRRSIMGGVRTVDGRRRSCFAAKGAVGGGGGTGGGGGPVDAAELARRRDLQERAARGRRASLLMQARSGGMGYGVGPTQVAPMPPKPLPLPQQPRPQPAHSGGNASAEAPRKASSRSCDDDSDDDDELILAAVAFMNGEAPPPPPAPTQNKKASPPKAKKAKKKTRTSAKYKKKPECKRLSEFSLMCESYSSMAGPSNDDDDSDDEGAGGPVGPQNNPPSSSAAEAYRLAMEREQAALANAHNIMSQQGLGGGGSGGGGQKKNQEQPGGRSSLVARKELPNKKPDKPPVFDYYEEEGIPAVQLTPDVPPIFNIIPDDTAASAVHPATPGETTSVVVSPELARHRKKLEEAESNTQAQMEGMTLEQHKKLLQERFGGGTAQAPPTTASPRKQQAARPAQQQPKEKPVSAELLRHRKRLEEAERTTQAQMEGMTLDQHKKLLQERFGGGGQSAGVGKAGTPTMPAKEEAAPGASQQQTPAPKEASVSHVETLEQRARPTAVRSLASRSLQSTAGEAYPSLAQQGEGLAAATSETGAAPSSGARRDSQISLSRMDSRDEAVSSIGNRWRRNADRMRNGEKSDRWSNAMTAGGERHDAANQAAKQDMEDAQARALRAVAQSRNSDRTVERKSSKDILAMTNRLFEAIDAVDEDRVIEDALNESDHRAARSDNSVSKYADSEHGTSSSLADEIASLPPVPKDMALYSRRKSSLTSLMDESASSLLSWGAAAAGCAARRRMSDSASSLRLSIVSSASAAEARRRRSSGGGCCGAAESRMMSRAQQRHRMGGWEHPLGWSDALAFIGGLGEDTEWEKSSYARRRRTRKGESSVGAPMAAASEECCGRCGSGKGCGCARDDGDGEGKVGNRKKKKRVVRFPRHDHDLSSSRDVPHLIDIGPPERSSTWRTSSDREGTRDDVLVAMMSLQNGDGIRCTRGLEALASDEEWELRRINRDFVVAAVLEEQRAQGLMMEAGGGTTNGSSPLSLSSDEEIIAAASRARSAVSAEAALEAAIADAVFVQEHVRHALFDETAGRNYGDVAGRAGGAERSGPFMRFGVSDGGGGGGGGAMFGASTIPGMSLLTKHLSAEKCTDKLNDGNMICDFQRQGRQLFSRLRRAPTNASRVRSSAA